MSSVDDRIVNMKFNNGQFESGVKSTMSTLDRLKSALNFGGAKKGLDDLSATANGFNMGDMGGKVEGVSAKFLALSTVALTALSNITTKAIDTGISMVKALSTDPIMDGLKEYETNMNSIQTILANTASKGTNLDQVTAALEELNHYSDKTIYNFSEMASNIGMFTAAGVDLDTSVSAIKGIANLAAVSGSNSQQASTAMYQLSQALSTGVVKLQDWNSVVNAGMGGEVFQEALKRTAKVQGVAIDDIIAKNGSFRDSLQEGWLTADILNQTLMQFTGDMNAEQLKAMGYTEQQIQDIMAMGQTATDAATKIKTMSQLWGTLQETVGSGWAKSWQIVLGDFEEAKELFTGVNDVIGGMLGASADARNKMLQDWKDMGGRQAAIDGIKNAFDALMSVVTPIKEAFREIFPKKTGEDLYRFTVMFRDFMAGLKLGGETADKVKRVFKGFFSIFSTVGNIIGRVATVINRFFVAVLPQGAGSFLSAAASAGDFLVKLNELVTGGRAINDFFDRMIEGAEWLGLGLEELIYRVHQFFTNMSGESFSAIGDSLGGMFSNLDRFSQIGEGLSKFWNGLTDGLKKSIKWLEPFTDKVKEAFGGFKDAIKSAFGSGDFSGVMDAVNVGLLGGILLTIRKFMKDGLSLDFGGGMFESIKDTFGALTDTLGAMQANLKASALLKIAAAVGILTISVVALSMIDSGKLTKALIAMSVGFTQLVAAMAMLVKFAGAGGFIQIPAIAAALILLSTAILILTIAVKSLSKLSWDELAKGLIGVGALIAMLVTAANMLNTVGPGMIRAGAAMIVMALAVKILGSAVKDFAEMSWGEMLQGLLGVAGALGVLVAAVRLMPTNLMFSSGLAMAALAVGVKILASAVSDFAEMSWAEMGQGLSGLAAALAAVALGMNLMPKNMLPLAAGLVLVSISLNLIGKAVSSMGGMSWTEIGKGLITLGGSLGIVAAGIKLMSGSRSGAAALLVVSAALALFVPVLKILGNMSVGEIITALLALAGAFAVLGAAGYLLAPIAPVITGLSMALLGVAASFALVGLGAMALAQSFVLIASAGKAGVEVILTALSGIISLIPQLAVAMAEGIINFITTIAAGAPQIISSFGAILEALLQTVIDIAPKIGEAATAIITTFLGVINDNMGNIIQTGVNLLTNFLQGIANAMGKIVTSTVDIIVKFINGIANNIGKIIQAGFDLAIKFLNGIADGIKNNMSSVVDAALNIGEALIEGLWEGVQNLAGWLWDKIAGWAEDIWNGVLDFFGIASPSKKFIWVGTMLMKGFAGGIKKYGPEAIAEMNSVGDSVLDAINKSTSGFGDVLSGTIDMVPVITPVIDLSQVQAGANQINGLMDSVPPLDVQTSASMASGIAATNSEQPRSGEGGSATEIKFEQYNYSPKALDPIEVYRNTKNQISLAKEALDI